MALKIKFKFLAWSTKPPMTSTVCSAASPPASHPLTSLHQPRKGPHSQPPLDRWFLLVFLASGVRCAWASWMHFDPEVCLYACLLNSVPS